MGKEVEHEASLVESVRKRECKRHLGEDETSFSF